MKKIQFKTEINAPKEKVWDTMLNDATYRQWTKSFDPNSYYEGSWQKGSKIKFLGPAENGKTSGMFSEIAENIPYEFVSIKHLGIIKDGVEDTTSEEAKSWSPAFENYTFKDNGGKTELLIEMDADEKYSGMFNEMWPKALKRLKELCEN